MLRLKLERLTRGWTQKDLSREAGLPVTDICKIETGRFKPYPQYARKLEAVFQAPIHELLTEVDVDPFAIGLRPASKPPQRRRHSAVLVEE